MPFLDRFRQRRGQSASATLMSVFTALVNAETLSEAQRILEQHPELLTGEVEALAMQFARTQDNEEDFLMAVDAITLLRCSREIGVDAAIEQAGDMLEIIATRNSTLQEYIQTTRLDDLEQYLEAHPELFVIGVEACLDRFILSAQIRDNQDAFQRLQDRRTLLRKCREIGIEASFKELREAIDGIKPLMQKIWREYNQIAESDLFELERIMNSYPEILGHVFNLWLAYLGALTKTEGAQEALQRFENYQKLLRRCLEEGTEAVVREKLHIHPVAHSFATPREITCPHCGQNFHADIWLIIDTVERPDLLEKICDESLHAITCPNCSKLIGRAEPPLLVYQPGKSPTLLASPASDDSQNDLLSSLVDILRGVWELSGKKNG
jgi:hypothetical protein